MANSAAEPPDDGRVPDADDDELAEEEMTSIMDAEQRRQLQRAARALKEPERETARPPPEATDAVEAEIAIPKAAAVPESLVATPVATPVAKIRSTPPAARPTAAATSSATAATTPVFWVVAFVLLAAAIAFELR
jgi:hypothetical protein